MLSASQFATCNFLIGTNFNISHSPSSVAASIPTPTLQKLEISLTAPKSFTSEFLIDNSEHALCDVRRSGRRRTGTPHARPFPALKHLAAKAVCSRLSTVDSRLLSNRPSPRLEMPVSHRKQTIAPISNRPKFAVCNLRSFSFLASLPPCLSASSPLLIANDMHSRKSSSPCKQSTYQILIANEFHSAQSFLNLAKGPLPARPAWPIMVPRSAPVPVQEESWLRRNP